MLRKYFCVKKMSIKYQNDSRYVQNLCVTLCVLRVTLCYIDNCNTENHRGDTRVLRKVQAEFHRGDFAKCKQSYTEVF